MPSTDTPRLRKSDYLLMLLHKLGVFNLVWKSTPDTLTVLNYHRVDEPSHSSFDTFRPNVSTTPSGFARQMDYVAHKYHVISATDLVAFIRRGQKLPSHAALITFDDGYLDNYTNAYPILKVSGI
jgi:peptidoglycan/xylan/chitin deacetylase (PgdA/CDA1 family)